MSKNIETWILGNKVNLSTAAGQTQVMDLIDDARDRNAPGDLSSISYALLNCLLERGTYQIERSPEETEALSNLLDVD